MTKRYLNTPEEVVQALQSGKVVLDTNKNKYKMINGIIATYWASKNEWGLNMYINNRDNLYVEESEQLKLEVGKFYKTRDGRKAFIFTKIDNARYPFAFIVVDGDFESKSCTATGFHFDTKQDQLDLVAPWEE